MRKNWHDTKKRAEENPSPDSTLAHVQADRELSSYLWNRAKAEVEEDRRKHPRAKRNAPKPCDIEPRPGGRALP